MCVIHSWMGCRLAPRWPLLVQMDYLIFCLLLFSCFFALGILKEEKKNTLGVTK